MEDNTGKVWVILVSFRNIVLRIIPMRMRMSTQGIKELWFKGDSGKVFLEEDSLEAREEITLSTSHLLLGAEGNITRVSMEEGGVIIWSMIVRKAGVEEEEVQGDNLTVRVT